MFGVLMCMLLGMGFVACSDDDEENGNSIVGSWRANDVDGVMVWTFNSNGTCSEVYYYNDQEVDRIEYNYSFDAATSTLTVWGEGFDSEEETESVKLKFIDGNTIYLESEDGGITFTRV